MRILVLIIMVLSFLVGGFFSGFLYQNLESRTKNIDYEEIEALLQQVEAYKKDGLDLSKAEDPKIKQALEILEKTPSKSSINMAGILGVIVAVFALLMIILAFMKKDMVKIAAIVVPASAALLWFLTPSIEAGMTSGADPKSIALVGLIALSISAACAFLSYNMHLKKAETT